MTASWVLYLLGLATGAALTFLASALASAADNHSGEAWTVAAIVSRLESERGTANREARPGAGRHRSGFADLSRPGHLTRLLASAS